jgi:hypothetical protein
MATNGISRHAHSPPAVLMFIAASTCPLTPAGKGVRSPKRGMCSPGQFFSNPEAPGSEMGIADLRLSVAHGRSKKATFLCRAGTIFDGARRLRWQKGSSQAKAHVDGPSAASRRPGRSRTPTRSSARTASPQKRRKRRQRRHVGMGICRHTHPGARRPVEHPRRNPESSVSIATALAAAKNNVRLFIAS